SEPRLLTGRDSRTQEFLRVLRISREFIRGFRALHREAPCITFFGSARFGESTVHHARARELAARVASLGYTIITGGGPGLMDAAARGAKEVGGRTIGATIDIDQEPPSEAVDKVVRFHYFFARKVILVKYSFGYVHLPGGFGTLDEMFEALTLIQTKRLNDFPVVLYGRDYWYGLVEWIGDTLLAQGAIAERDLTRLIITDDPDEVVERFAETAKRHNLALRPPPGAWR
ncbi:MAG TPA: TIGR00730 family Rossman fold protein, partial [Acidimicrobiales bacterium]